jgi:hypothetical protein
MEEKEALKQELKQELECVGYRKKMLNIIKNTYEKESKEQAQSFLLRKGNSDLGKTVSRRWSHGHRSTINSDEPIKGTEIRWYSSNEDGYKYRQGNGKPSKRNTEN